jgi:hypothetical protein
VRPGPRDPQRCVMRLHAALLPHSTLPLRRLMRLRIFLTRRCISMRSGKSSARLWASNSLRLNPPTLPVSIFCMWISPPPAAFPMGRGGKAKTPRPCHVTPGSIARRHPACRRILGEVRRTLHLGRYDAARPRSERPSAAGEVGPIAGSYEEDTPGYARGMRRARGPGLWA